ncbi:MAG: hypothetical protein AAF641_06595 [Pseudomonadota bacterium]
MRRLLICLAVLAVSACAGANDLDGPPVYLGEFKLGHNIVVAPAVVKGPGSREATDEEWIEAVTQAVDARFGRYEGPKFVNLGISVDGYVLAKTGIPIVAAPRSALIIRVTAWNDAKAVKFNEDAKSITVVEDISADTTVGSGLTRTKEEQIADLSKNAAKLIEKWLVEQNNELGWFEEDGRPAKNKRTPRFQPGLTAPAPVATDPPAAAPADTLVETPAEAAAEEPAPAT